jgi:glycosyltransferase involved in cell wall biosynthesis
VNGLAVDFFAYRKLANRIEAALEQPEKMQALRTAARATAVTQFDLNRLILPRWLTLFDDLVNRRRPAVAPIAAPQPAYSGTLKSA